jgi:flagellar basal-body rod modification protein FlgD
MAEVSAADSKYAAAGALSSAAAGSGVMDKNAFLMLLVTQFQYQDPLNPMEDKEFVAQLAQFSALEQSMAMNENLQSMLAMQQEQQILYAVNYIGKEVLARGYGISVSDGGKTVTSVDYALDAAAVKGFINILDSSNSIVTTLDLPALGYGIHTFNWDGRDSSGQRVPDGVYTVALSATDADGQLIIPDTQVSGIVKGISTYQGEQYLTLTDNRVVAIKNVREVLSSAAAVNPSDDG